MTSDLEFGKLCHFFVFVKRCLLQNLDTKKKFPIEFNSSYWPSDAYMPSLTSLLFTVLNLFVGFFQEDPLYDVIVIG